MPFYSKLINNIKKKSKKMPATLQVQYIYKNILNKRVYVSASLTVEAAMSFSMFILLMLSLTGFFGLLNTHRKIQAITDKIVREASAYAYVYTLKEGEKAYGDFGVNLGEFAISSLCKRQINDLKESSSIYALRTYCEFMQDDENISLEVKYKYALPFSLFLNSKINQSAFSKRRAYIGKISRKKSDEENSSLEDELVFIGKNPTRYHLDRNCHYLYNDVSMVKFEDIKKLRNKNGSRYTACERCAKNIKGGAVYIMPSGTSYHTDKNCSAIRAYVKVVRKSSVEHLGVCSYCGGK